MRWLIRNWQLKLGALGLATVLYTGLVFSGSFTDGTIGGVTIQRINQPSGAYVITQNLPTVEVHYRRSQDATEPVNENSFAATVDLQEYDMERPGQPQSLPITVKSLAGGVRVLDIKPTTVKITLDRLGSKEVDVVVDHGAVPDGLELGPPSVSTPQVTARGPSSFVAQVVRAEATVAIDASGIDYHNANVELKPVDASGAVVQFVDLNPSVVTVDIPVEQVLTNKTVPVSVKLAGSPAAGYAISDVSADPLTVTLRGAPAALATINDVATEPITVDGIKTSRSFTSKLVVPTGVQLAPEEPTSVTVKVAVAPEEASRTFLVGITCTGAPAGGSCLPQVSQIAVTLSGTSPALDALKIDQITPVVDVSGLGPGSHDVTPTVSLPAGISVVSFSPAQVTVRVTAPSPSPTPGA